MSIEISPKSFFEQPSVADMRLIACPGAEELTELIRPASGGSGKVRRRGEG